jgi:hypothetical protein
VLLTILFLVLPASLPRTLALPLGLERLLTTRRLQIRSLRLPDILRSLVLLNYRNSLLNLLAVVACLFLNNLQLLGRLLHDKPMRRKLRSLLQHQTGRQLSQTIR